jgi:anti-sigma factor RsiW
VIRRAGCAELAELRSAYVDGALPDRDRERLLAHLVDCADCRADIAELRRVRSLLAAPSDPVGAPQHLSSRLLSIAGPEAGKRPPSRRPPRFVRRAAVAGTALITGLAAFATVGYVAAPSTAATPVGDPGVEALSEFGGVMASLPLANASVGAVAAIQPTRTQFTPLPHAVTSSGVAKRLSGDEARARLELAAVAPSRLSFSGVQSYQAVRTDQQITATVRVVNVAGQGLQMRVVDQSGREVNARFVPAASESRLSERTLVAQVARRYALVGWQGSMVADRQATVVEARPWGVADDAPPRARWWVDASTGLLLWQETYDDRGDVLTSSGYQSLTLGESQFLSHLPPTVVSRTTTAFTLDKSEELASQGWTPPRSLSGMRLLRLRCDRAEDPQILHLVYTDGLSVVSVFERRGQLATAPAGSVWDEGRAAYVRWGSASTASWQSGGTVFTVVTNGSPEVLSAVVKSLPHQPVPQRTTMERILAGWERVLDLG